MVWGKGKGKAMLCELMRGMKKRRDTKMKEEPEKVREKKEKGKRERGELLTK